MNYDQHVAQRQRAAFWRGAARRPRRNGGFMKYVLPVSTVALGVVALVAALATISAYPLMLVLGGLHNSHNLSAVPALGFFQTLGSLFVLGSIGSALRGASVNTSSKS